MKDINLIIIGIGPHAKRIYLPILNKYKELYKVNLKLGIDIKEKRDDVETYLKDKRINLPMLFIDKFPVNKDIPNLLKSHLTKFVKDYQINAVIIATEPLVHKQYALWALANKLNILMDKPISTREDIVSDINQAIMVKNDYTEILDAYRRVQKKHNTIFSVNAQRRYHIGFQKVINLIRETAERFNAPVTSMQISHADGQWRLPSEIVTQIYHPYCQGYGGCSHSGYHEFDIACQYYKAGIVEGKEADEGEVVSSFLQPRGFIKQFNENDYFNYFGDQYKQIFKWKDIELQKLYKDYGEIDAFSIIRLLRKNENICNIAINILHNTFARRTWVVPGKDLYKGNGRVKHEYHNIQQGPFQNIQIHSYQASDKHDGNNENEYGLGGNNHLDIYVFRNAGMFGLNEKPFRIYTLNELIKENGKDITRLTTDYMKEVVVEEFLRFIQGEINKDNLISNLTTQKLSVDIMSAIYQSNIKHLRNENPWIKFKIND